MKNEKTRKNTCIPSATLRWNRLSRKGNNEGLFEKWLCVFGFGATHA